MFIQFYLFAPKNTKSRQGFYYNELHSRLTLWGDRVARKRLQLLESSRRPRAVQGFYGAETVRYLITVLSGRRQM